MQIPDAAIGPILAAMIAALVVFISTVLSKEQKTSEFRQAWIDELRKDVAQYVSGTVEFAALYSLRKKLKTDDVELLEDNFDAIRELQSIEYRIIFRLNPLKHANLISKIKGLRRQMISLYAQGVASGGLEEAITDAITSDCKLILKAEWERVKKGEAGFRLVKWAAMAIASVGLLALLFYIFIGPTSKNGPPKVQTAEEAERAFRATPTPLAITTGGQTVHVNLTAPVDASATGQLPKKPVTRLPISAPDLPIRRETVACNVVAARCPAEP